MAILFDFKMEDLIQKAWLVAGEHMIKTSTIITYANIVFRETICIAMMTVVLNDHDAVCRHLKCTCGETCHRKSVDHFGS